MRVHPRRKSPPEEWRRRVVGLDYLPLRPATVRLLIGSLPDEPPDDDPEPVESPKMRSACGLDPGWILARSTDVARNSPLALIAQRPWWPRTVSSGPAAEFLGRLWRHSVAVGIAARGLAREAGDPDPDAIARAGQLCGLGCWAVAAVEPEWLVGLVASGGSATATAEGAGRSRHGPGRPGASARRAMGVRSPGRRRRLAPRRSRRIERRLRRVPTGWRSSRRPTDGPNRPPGRSAGPIASRRRASPGSGS